MAGELVKVGGALLVVVLVGGAGLAAWAKAALESRLSQHFAPHAAEIPVPFPLTDAEIEALRVERAAAQVPAEGTTAPADPLAGVDLNAVALDRAIARGEHLVNARYACVECHGKDFGGGVMIDDDALGHLLGPNLTTGKGSTTAAYTTADWDHIVRHGVKPDGTPAVMPASDFVAMTDHELSDIIAFIRSRPPVDRPSEAVTWGPVGTVLVATGKFPLSAEELRDHQAPHVVEPPAMVANAELGAHLVKVCTGCHSQNLAGGPIKGAPPDWLPASNLTPDEHGLKGWTYETFATAMRDGRLPNGGTVRAPMTQMLPYAQRMTDVELQALWAYLSTLPATPSPT